MLMLRIRADSGVYYTYIPVSVRRQAAAAQQSRYKASHSSMLVLHQSCW